MYTTIRSEDGIEKGESRSYLFVPSPKEIQIN